LSLLTRILGGRSDRDQLAPLYRRIVEIGRDPAWYRAGQVPDTVNGRFDIIAAVLALVLIRLEREEDREARNAGTFLTEIFIQDMDGSLRQIGIGDLVVGKHIGRVMSALGGRLAAFRPAMADRAGMETAVTRNIFHEAAPGPEAVTYVSDRLFRLARQLDAASAQKLIQGEVPRP
jgi:cytochrome b pre-mRNA-processing protein 3